MSGFSNASKASTLILASCGRGMLTIEMMVEVHGRKVEVERKEDR